MKNKLLIWSFIVTTLVYTNNLYIPLQAFEIIKYEDRNIVDSISNISFVVVDENNNPISKAIFGIYKNDQLITKSESDEQGLTNFKEIPYDDYYIKQLSTPTNYIVDNEKYYITCSKDEPTVVLDNIINLTKNIDFDISQQVSKKIATIDQIFNYKITIKNISNQAVNNVSIVDIVPSYLDIIKINSGTIDNNIVTYNLDNFEINQEITLIIMVKVNNSVIKEEQIENEIIINDNYRNTLSSTLSLDISNITDDVVNVTSQFDNHKLIGSNNKEFNNNFNTMPFLGASIIIISIISFIKLKK